MKTRSEQEYEELENTEKNDTENAIALMLAILDDIHEDVDKELTSFYQRYGKDGIVTYAEAQRYISQKNHKRKITLLLSALDDALSDGVSRIELELWDIINKVCETEFDFLGMKQSDYDPTEFYNYQWGDDDKTWKDRLWDDKGLWLAALMSDIKQEMIRGHKISTVIKSLNKRFKSMQTIIERLVQTETVTIRTYAREVIFKISKIKEYIYNTQADERVCEICGPLHKKIFPMSQLEVGVTAPPLHPRCRCWIMPVIGDQHKQCKLSSKNRRLSYVK